MSALRVIVGISGGVDSSVAALLLQRQGYEVHGVFMKNWEEAHDPGYCSAADDVEDAEDVCRQLGIALHKVNFSAEYRERVFAHFLAEHRRGRTPNPDILCNSEVKFRAFLDHAQTLGADRIATGHYARIARDANTVRLLKGHDPNKDQSYFLHALNADQLAASLFPLGHLHKTQVRTLAAEAGLVTAQKADSTGICFIGERRLGPFLDQFLGTEPGMMCTPEGEVVGTHRGLMYYTIGQRQGLGIGGGHGRNGLPWFVAEKRLEDNTLVVVQGHDHPHLLRHALRTGPMHWINPAPSLPLHCTARIRYRQADQPCTVVSDPDSDGVLLYFDHPQRAVTPGQSAVLYRDEECLGGAIIEHGIDLTERHGQKHL